mmetsp:Transcript_2636/g.6126  ORF Transcript_2636/g.6126 Transcript_2636/m.6126 type:complete len:223 (+) Transcript_2636:221-889(+)
MQQRSAVTDDSTAEQRVRLRQMVFVLRLLPFVFVGIFLLGRGNKEASLATSVLMPIAFLFPLGFAVYIMRKRRAAEAAQTQDEMRQQARVSITSSFGPATATSAAGGTTTLAPAESTNTAEDHSHGYSNNWATTYPPAAQQSQVFGSSAEAGAGFNAGGTTTGTDVEAGRAGGISFLHQAGGDNTQHMVVTIGGQEQADGTTDAQDRKNMFARNDADYAHVD